MEAIPENGTTDHSSIILNQIHNVCFLQCFFCGFFSPFEMNLNLQSLH